MLDKKTSTLLAIVAATLIAGGCASSDSIPSDGLPAVTKDGLTRVPSKKLDALYWADGASLAGYDSVLLADTPVAFRKDWERDYNADRMDLTHRVTDKDMERIKADLSAAFRDEFTKTLEKGGYKVVDQPGSGVLGLRPAIINLDVNAPDLQTPDNMKSFTTAAGEMTLVMELVDTTTGAKIAEVVDRQGESPGSGWVQYTNSVTNKAEADRIIRSWANVLVDALDEARGQ